MDDLNLDELEKNINNDNANNNAVKDKFAEILKHKKDAEDKLGTLSKEKAELETTKSNLEKENSFLNSFTDVTAKFPTASEYREQIKAKVMSGYSVDDATVAVLHAEGKYTPPVQKMENVAGGSAPNQITNQPVKSVKEMTSNERWGTLKEAEQRGDIFMS